MHKLKMITIEQLLEMKENNEDFDLVDVLDSESYSAGHIPGSRNIPLSDIEKGDVAVTDVGKTLIVYCASYHCTASTRAARKLMEMDIERVLDFKAGKRGWLAAGLKLER